MTIERNGVVIELAPEEIRTIYETEKRSYLAQDIVEQIQKSSQYDDLTDDEAMWLCDVCDGIAENAMRIFGNHDTFWDCYWSVIDAAITNAIASYRDQVGI